MKQLVQKASSSSLVCMTNFPQLILVFQLTLKLRGLATRMWRANTQDYSINITLLEAAEKCPQTAVIWQLMKTRTLPNHPHVQQKPNYKESKIKQGKFLLLVCAYKLIWIQTRLSWSNNRYFQAVSEVNLLPKHCLPFCSSHNQCAVWQQRCLSSTNQPCTAETTERDGRGTKPSAAYTVQW